MKTYVYRLVNQKIKRIENDDKMRSVCKVLKKFTFLSLFCFLIGSLYIVHAPLDTFHNTTDYLHAVVCNYG